ncbi:uncharacterized protein MONOS_17162 [Monocercomonoides exilis]|uniref:uncharacterized protein n=1 Tax=Monocercomonoides exilis TaxID=2049356 RepID=UPI0035598A42|nr:hypothetical protein MONOS_17162 [Monocercomonoides exilis]
MQGERGGRHMRRNKEKRFCGLMASVGGGGGERQEEGTSALALCIGGVETEEDEGLTTRGCFAMERDRKRMEVFVFYWLEEGHGR